MVTIVRKNVNPELICTSDPDKRSAKQRERQEEMIRKANENDLAMVAQIYEHIHTQEEAGHLTIGWARGVYPVADTARAALKRDDLFVLEAEGQILGAAIINQTQVDVYADGSWAFPAADSDVMVLHTLVIEPDASGKGLGRQFVRFYETYAAAHGCHCLRMDTNARNTRARAMYRKLGYREAGIVPCVFNGIEGVGLVLLEKQL